MNNRKSLHLLAEQYSHVQTNQILCDAFEKDLKAFEQYIINEGLWDTIKQKGSQLVGSAKAAILQPLIKMVLNKAAKDDPEGFKALAAAANDPAKFQALLTSPEVKQQQQALSQDVAATAEGLDEELYEEYLNEAYGYLVGEAPRVLSNDPRNVRRRELAAQRRGSAPAAADAPVGPYVAPAAPAAAAPAAAAPAAAAPAAVGEPAAAPQGGGFIRKAINWVKAHPKITMASALALVLLSGGAAAIPMGATSPMLMAMCKVIWAGQAAGMATHGAENIYKQVKGGEKFSLKSLGNAVMKGGVKGGNIGAVAAAGVPVAAALS